MPHKFTYLTVPNSGTRFLERYFIYIGLSPIRFATVCRECGETHGYEKHLSEKNMSGKYKYIWNHYSPDIPKKKSIHIHVADCNEHNPVLSTLRHPHKTAISFLARGNDLEKCLNIWENFIWISSRMPMVYFDIDCAKEHRKAHLLDIIRKVDCYDSETEELTDEFVKAWKPVGVYRSDIKREHQETGKLPDVFDWSRFDRAVNWYNETIGEVRDNFPS